MWMRTHPYDTPEHWLTRDRLRQLLSRHPASTQAILQLALEHRLVVWNDWHWIHDAVHELGTRLWVYETFERTFGTLHFPPAVEDPEDELRHARVYWHKLNQVVFQREVHGLYVSTIRRVIHAADPHLHLHFPQLTSRVVAMLFARACFPLPNDQGPWVRECAALSEARTLARWKKIERMWEQLAACEPMHQVWVYWCCPSANERAWLEARWGVLAHPFSLMERALRRYWCFE